MASDPIAISWTEVSHPTHCKAHTSPEFCWEWTLNNMTCTVPIHHIELYNFWKDSRPQTLRPRISLLANDTIEFFLCFGKVVHDLQKLQWILIMWEHVVASTYRTLLLHFLCSYGNEEKVIPITDDSTFSHGISTIRQDVDWDSCSLTFRRILSKGWHIVWSWSCLLVTEFQHLGFSGADRGKLIGTAVAETSLSGKASGVPVPPLCDLIPNTRLRTNIDLAVPLAVTYAITSGWLAWTQNMLLT